MICGVAWPALRHFTSYQPGTLCGSRERPRLRFVAPETALSSRPARESGAKASSVDCGTTRAALCNLRRCLARTLRFSPESEENQPRCGRKRDLNSRASRKNVVFLV